MKPRTWKLLSAAMVGILLILACGNPYTGPATQTPLPTYTQPAGEATQALTATQLPTTTPTPLGVTTQTFITDATQLSSYAPGQETAQIINDRYGQHYYRQPGLPFTDFPNMAAPLSGTTYEVRPVYVDVTQPGCNSTMAVGTPCSVWANGNHAFIHGYANQWQAEADIADQWPLIAGEKLLFERMDDTYLYAKTADFGDMYTFVLSAISLTPPAANLISGDGTEQYYWWEVPVYAPWGPLDTNLIETGKVYTVFSYGMAQNFVSLMACTDAQTYIAQATVPPPGTTCHYEGRDDYLPARVLAVVTNSGLWVEYADGTVGFAFNTHTWHFQPGFYDVNHLSYPGGALGQ